MSNDAQSTLESRNPDRTAAVRDLLKRLNAARSGLSPARFESLRRLLERLNNELPVLRLRAQRMRLVDAPDFNLFRALNLARKEAICHTPLLAHLLDPRAEHGQGMLFLERFLPMVGGEIGRIPREELSKATWVVRAEEKVDETSRIDVVVRSMTLGVLVAIENKVDHGEGVKQLQRYSDWLSLQRGGFDKRVLVFLTPSGRDGQSGASDSHVRLSYRDHLGPWLREAMPHVGASPVRETIRQYVEIIENL